MATYTKINDWILYLTEDVNLSTDTFRIALSNTDPTSETPNPITQGNGILVNVTEIDYTNYSDTNTADRVLDNVQSTLSGGVLSFSADDFQIEADGGALPEFRYIYAYDDTVTDDPLIAVWDIGFGISLDNGDDINVDFSPSGIFTVQ